MTPKPYDVRTLRYVARALRKSELLNTRLEQNYKSGNALLTAAGYAGKADCAAHYAWLFRGQADSIAKAERAKRKRGGRK